MKILGFTINKARKITRRASPMIKKDTTWGKLWATVQEWKLFRSQVTQPYAQVANVYKAVKAICDNVPQADVGFYTYEKDEEAYPKELMKLFERPNALQSGSDFIQELAGYYALYGEAYIIKRLTVGNLTGANKLPGELINISPKKVEPIKGKDEYGNETIIAWNVNNKRLSLEEVIPIKDFNPYDSLRGLSPLIPLNHEIDLDYLTMVYNKAFFDNDATPDFVMTTDKNLSEEQRKRITEWHEKRHKGAEKAHKFSIFEGGLKPEILSSTHKDMDFIEQKKYLREEVIGTFKAPKALFNITEDLNFATFMGQMKIFWIYAIMPILRKVEDALNAHLISQFNAEIYLKFDIKNVPAFQEDLKDKVATANTLFAMGFTANEINEKLGLGFEEEVWRDFWWISPMLMPADQVLNNPLGQDTENADQEPNEKSLLVHKDIRLMTVWKAFLGKQGGLERIFEGKIRRYFYEQRKRFLAVFTAENMGQAEKVLNWSGENDELRKYARPIIDKCIREGAELGKLVLGNKKDIADDILNHKLEAYLGIRCDLILGINRTTQNRIKAALEEGIKLGETYQELSARAKDTFNTVGARAKLIARTETAGGVNGGSMIYYKENDVDQKQWLTAGDEVVRESHRHIDGEIVSIDQRFGNGLRYPGDQDGEAGEVCNCRCTLVPIIK